MGERGQGDEWVSDPDAHTVDTSGSHTRLSSGPSESTRGRRSAAEERESIGRYRLGRVLGRGGMGVVRAAHDPELDREVAIKVLLLRPERDHEARERLLREAQTMAQLSHPSVVQVYDVGTEGDEMFIAMELVEGPTLQRWVEQHEPAWPEVVDAMIAAGEGLLAAHERGIVHRDFKPSNVLVSPDGRFEVADFGIAATVRDPESSRTSIPVGPPSHSGSHPRLTRAGTVMGTPGFMAPEQWTGHTDELSDQFAFCAALYVAIFRTLPFEGKSARELVRAIADGPSFPPQPRIPGWLRAVITRGVASKPRDRFHDMGEVLAALRAGRRGTGRRTGAIAAGVLLLGVSATGYALWPSSETAADPSCDGGERIVAEVWNDDARRRVREAFGGSAVSYATASLERVEAGLDAYAEQWSSMHREACEDTRIRGSQPESMLDLRVGCLRRHFAGFGSLVGLLEQADATVVQQAGGAVAKLPPLHRCRDLQALAQALPPPSDPVMAERVEQARQHLAQASALYMAGSPKAALERAEAVRSDADALGYGPLQVEVRMALGQIQEQLGNFPEAVASYEKAFHDATALSYDEIAARCAARLVFIVGARLAKADEAETWARHSVSLLARMPPHRLIEGELANAQAVVAFGQGHYERAETLFEQALERWDGTLPEDQPNLALLYTNLTALYGIRERHEEALAAAEHSLEIALRMFGAGHPHVGAAYNNIGASEFRLGRYGPAREHLDKALEIRRAALGPEHPEVADTLSNMALLRRHSGDPAGGIALHQQVVAIYEKAFGPDHPKVASSLNNYSDSLYVDRRYDEAIAAAERSHEIFEARLGPTHPNTTMARFNEGMARLDAGQTERGAAIIRESAKNWIDVLGPEHAYLGFSLLGTGKAALALGELDLAIAELERSKARLDANDPTPDWRAEARFALAQAHWAKGEQTQARQHALEARELFGQAGPTRSSYVADVEAWLTEH